MDTNNQDKEPNWEKRLENLRRTRRMNTVPDRVPPVQTSEAAKGASALKLDDASRNRVLKAYLKKWQEEHNTAVADCSEEVETDPMIVLQENWLNAQASLQMSVSEKHIESRRKIRFDAKKDSAEFETAQIGDGENADAAESGTAADGVAENGDGGAEEALMPVQINILNPKAVNRREVFCLSEQELTERLIKRLRPHLTDTVNGIIRTAVQKQMAVFTYQLQQMLHEQAGAVVEDVLEHDVRKILNDIKYELKYKR
ncbi:hypothetical protein [Neisseria meningitidis]|uniref:hypothetical protein n=1 Tax=Neisseria meningitidis TaxID=487 RepID=UPI000FCAA585|nr:hypothetical protein [Neisseria meningitidis]